MYKLMLNKQQLNMATTEQQNGNPCTNETRNTFNRRVSKYSMLGKTKKVQWSDRRRHRNI